MNTAPLIRASATSEESSIGQPVHGLNASALEFKRVMTASIERALEADTTLTKKAIAMDLGATAADLSHWLSEKTRFTMPAHLVPVFCAVVGDNSLLWHLQTTYEKAPARPGA